jgi:hypothetical protein
MFQPEEDVGAARGDLSRCCGVPGLKAESRPERDLGGLLQDLYNWTQQGSSLALRLKIAVHHSNHSLNSISQRSQLGINFLKKNFPEDDFSKWMPIFGETIL